MGGPLVYFMETGTMGSSIVMVNNSFNLIMGYIGTTVIQAKRIYDPTNSPLYYPSLS